MKALTLLATRKQSCNSKKEQEQKKTTPVPLIAINRNSNFYLESKLPYLQNLDLIGEQTPTLLSEHSLISMASKEQGE